MRLSEGESNPRRALKRFRAGPTEDAIEAILALTPLPVQSTDGNTGSDCHRGIAVFCPQPGSTADAEGVRVSPRWAVTHTDTDPSILMSSLGSGHERATAWLIANRGSRLSYGRGVASWALD